MTKRVLLARPRGYCAGVDRAVATVEKALEAHGAPVYVRKQIVHNRHVVQTLESRGVVFVDHADEVPAGAVVVFSAHGVSPVVREQAATRPGAGEVAGHHQREPQEHERDEEQRPVARGVQIEGPQLGRAQSHACRAAAIT